MKKFSWHTDDKPSISTYINGAPKKRYLVVDGIDVVGRAVMHYKPNRKGGNTHNHIYNVLFRSTFNKGTRSVGVMKPYYRLDLLKAMNYLHRARTGKWLPKEFLESVSK